MSKTDTIVRMHSDGTLHRVMPDGTEVPLQDPGPLPPMTEEEVHAAAMRDPDARPMTDEEFARARKLLDVVKFEFNVSEKRLREIKSLTDVFVNLRFPNAEGASGSLA